MNSYSNILIPAALIVIMFGIGLGIPFSSFKKVFTEPRALITGLVSQLVLLPLVAFLIALAWDIEPGYKAGLLLIAACPGGTASNLVTFMLNGRVALSVALTAFNSFLIMLTIPLIVDFSTYWFLQETQHIGLSFWSTFQNIAYTVAIPVMAGMLVYHFMPNTASRIKRPLRFILPLILLFVFGYVLLAESSSGSTETLFRELRLVWPALLLNASTIMLGYQIAKRIGVNHRGSYTIAIEMGLQNSALAIFIAEQLLQNRQMLVVALIYSSFTFFTTLGLGYILKRRGETAITT